MYYSVNISSVHATKIAFWECQPVSSLGIQSNDFMLAQVLHISIFQLLFYNIMYLHM